MKSSLLNQITTYSERETLQFGKELARRIDKGDVLCISGDMGAGKTHLIKGIAEGFGIDPTKVNSPTFTLVNEYKGHIKLFHFDLFRVKNEKELLEIGLEEYLYGDGVCLIEWPEKMETLIPENAVNVKISKLGSQTRMIEISGFSE
jgi:tRNA threonylcarbamoyladenosine biosynthesis protein TsaE